MTFNKKDNYSLQTPFIEDNVNELLHELQEKFIEFNRNYEDLKDFNLRLDKMTLVDYSKVKPLMHDKITSTPDLLNSIRGITNRISSLDIKSPKLKTKAYEQVKIVDEKIITKNNELSKIINDIVERETMLFRRTSVADSNKSSVYTDIPIMDNYEDNINDNVDFRESKIILKDVKDNREYLESREKELAAIKKISNQVMSITQAMTSEVKKQGEALGGIEDNVIQVKDNAVMAEREISEAEKITRASSRRMFWLFIFLCIFVVSIIVVIVLIFLPSDDEKRFLL